MTDEIVLEYIIHYCQYGYILFSEREIQEINQFAGVYAFKSSKCSYICSASLLYSSIYIFIESHILFLLLYYDIQTEICVE